VGEHLLGGVQVGLLPAQPAAQAVEGLQLPHVGAVAVHPPDAGEGGPVRGGEGDDDAVGDGEHLAGVHAVGVQKVAHRLLRPVNLPAAEQELAPQIRA